MLTAWGLVVTAALASGCGNDDQQQAGAGATEGDGGSSSGGQGIGDACIPAGEYAASFPGFMEDLDRKLQSLDVRPASQVYWQECRDVLLRLGMDLPTEAQWEYAARAGTGSPWYTGSDSRSLIGHANLRDSAMMHRDRQQRAYHPTLVYEEWLDDGYAELAPVGSYLANPFGLYDVLGNASEWCRDWFQVYYCPVRSGSGERRRGVAPAWAASIKCSSGVMSSEISTAAGSAPNSWSRASA